MVYRRIQWTVETQFHCSEISIFKNYRFYTDNLVTLTTRIQSAFLRKASTIATFLNIDNVIPSILIRNIGFPACICKFVENLLAECFIYTTQNGDGPGPLITHKGTQDSILSPFLFNIYLRNIGCYLHTDSHILQYADDIILFSRNGDIILA